MAGQPKRRRRAANGEARHSQRPENIAAREAAEGVVAEHAERVAVVNATEVRAVVDDMAARGETLFPVVPHTVYRGVDAEFAEAGREFRPDNHWVSGAIHEGAANTVYWTPERRAIAANEIALRMACGEAVKTICGDGRDRSRLPREHTFYRWIFALGDEYVAQVYQLARQMRAERCVDELLEIADSARECDDMAMVQGHRLAIEARQWIAERILPRLYGKKSEGASGVTVNIATNLGGDDADGDGAYRIGVVADGDAGAQ